MPRLMHSAVKMVAVILVIFAAAYFSGVWNLSIIFWVGLVALICFSWGGWLWFNGNGWKWQCLIVSVLAVVVSGLSLFLYADYLIGLMGGRHIGPQANPFGRMAHLSNLEGAGLVLAGILLMTYVDYRRPSKPMRLLSPVIDEQETAGSVWPPAPKQP